MTKLMKYQEQLVEALCVATSCSRIVPAWRVYRSTIAVDQMMPAVSHAVSAASYTVHGSFNRPELQAMIDRPACAADRESSTFIAYSVSSLAVRITSYCQSKAVTYHGCGIDRQQYVGGEVFF